MASPIVRTALQCLLLGLGAAGLVLAIMPVPPPAPGDLGSQGIHVLGFAALTILACGAYPGLGTLTLLAILAAFAALSEALQILAATGREASMGDFLADCLGIAAGFAVVLAGRGILRPAIKIRNTVASAHSPGPGKQ